MELRILNLIAVALAALVLVQAQQQQQCRQTFLQGFYRCAQQAGVNPQNLLFFTTAGQQGQRPQNELVFRQQACQVELVVVNCTERVKENLINSSTVCQPAQIPAIREVSNNIFRPYDQRCANPCRQTLLLELRRCYERAGLDANLFITNATQGRGTILGTSQYQVDQFCRNKNTLTSCMTLARNKCLQADQVLRPIGLDVGSLQGAIDFICLNQNVYLRGMQCFNSPSPEVLQCRQSNIRNLNRLFFQENVKSARFTMEYCRLRLDDVDCERRAWERKRSSECNPTILGLRTELECKLLPNECVWSATTRVGDICRTENYHRNNRYMYGAATTPASFGLPFLAALAVAVLWTGALGWE